MESVLLRIEVHEVGGTTAGINYFSIDNKLLVVLNYFALNLVGTTLLINLCDTVLVTTEIQYRRNQEI